MSEPKIEKWLVHAVMSCEECGWEEGNFLEAQETARAHAKKYGHKVAGELGYALVYDGHKDRQEAKR